ncbi:MAG TPA: hypothetical protein H9662_00865 [Firmicutes bacterium]|nr:hypothetical protein [Bacillota bacterium]
MKNNQNIALLEARLNRLERNKKENYNICRKIRRGIKRLKEETESEKGVCQSQKVSE